MENKNIIIILVAIIVVLAALAGFIFLQSANAKEPTKIKITSYKEQYENDGKLSIKLTDLNNTPISKEIVNITITNKKGKVIVDDIVKTNKKGKAKLNLDLKKGKYKVVVSYGGNENYTGNNTTQKLTIKEEVVEAEVTSSQSQASSGNSYSVNDLPPSNDPYPETSREQIDENTVMQKYEDGYISYVDLRTGKRSSGGYYK